jgi:hypothetical protein
MLFIEGERIGRHFRYKIHPCILPFGPHKTRSILLPAILVGTFFVAVDKESASPVGANTHYHDIQQPTDRYHSV